MRTSTYQFTVDNYNANDVVYLKRLANELTKTTNSVYTVRLRGRLGRNNPFKMQYASGKGKIPQGNLYRETMQDIKTEHSTRFDVYVYRKDK